MSTEVESTCSRFSRASYIAGAHGGIGFGLSVFFNLVHPVSGIIFGAVHYICNTLLKPGFKEFLNGTDAFVSKIMVFAATFFTAAALAALASTAVGFSCSIFTWAILSLYMIPASIAVEWLFSCCFISQQKETKA